MSGSPDAQAYRAHLGEYTAQQPTRPFAEAVDVLGQQYPVWVLAPDATVRAANQLAAWLWGALSRAADVSAGIVGASTLLGRSAFSVICDNVDRIPLAQNHDFSVAHLALIERLSFQYKSVRPDAYELAHRLYNGHPPLIRLYEGSPPDPEKVFGYTFSIKPPLASSEVQLRFQTTIDWVHDTAGGDRGMLVQYRPAPDSPETAGFVDQAGIQIATALPGLPPTVPEGLNGWPHPVLTVSDDGFVSPLTQAILAESPVRLYLDRSAASRMAVAAFEEARERFQPVEAAPEAGAPWVEFGGQRYSGVEHVRQFVLAMQRFDSGYRDAVKRLVPEKFGQSDAAAVSWLEQQRQLALRAARAITDA